MSVKTLIDFTEHNTLEQISILLVSYVSLQCIKTVWGLIEKPVLMLICANHFFSLRFQTCIQVIQNRLWLDLILLVSVCITLRNESVSSCQWHLCRCVTFGVCGWSGDTYTCDRERKMCEIVGFVSFFSLMCLLTKGLKAAVPPLKEEIVVSDKLWKKRQCKNRESEGPLECLISLSAEENTHTQAKVLSLVEDLWHRRWSTTSTVPFTPQKLSHFVFPLGNLFLWVWFYAKRYRDEQK